MKNAHTTTTVTVDGERVTVLVPAGYRLVSDVEYKHLNAAHQLVQDLDRSEVGRHAGDRESQDPSGFSQGNQFLVPGDRIGTRLSGKPIIVPRSVRTRGAEGWWPTDGCDT